MLIRPLGPDDEAAALAAQAELAPFDFLLDRVEGEAWTAYVARLDAVSRGDDLAPGRVPATFLVAETGGEIAGRVSVRHELNPWLREHGGHIGYGVRPAYRRRGVATALLAHGLTVLRGLGVPHALLVCDAGNAASAATIERAGGVLEHVDAATRRYWVPTA